MGKDLKTALILIAFSAAMAIAIVMVAIECTAQSGRYIKVDSVSKTHVFLSVDISYFATLDTFTVTDTGSILLFKKPKHK